MPNDKEPETDVEVGARQGIVERIEREAGVPGLTSILAQKLSPTDLQSLLLEVYRLRAKGLTPQRILESHVSNRFGGSSSIPPTQLQAWDSLAWQMLPEGFEAVELSPVSPLGTVSVLTGLSQDWSVSTSRNTEVVSDCTNVLALECAVRRSNQLRVDSADRTRIHLAASHRVLRGQKFEEAPGVRQHFRLFSLCSAGRDEGSLRFETEAALEHIRYFVRTVARYLGPTVPVRVAVASLLDDSQRRPIEAGVVDRLRDELKGFHVGWEDATPQGRAYYRTLRFHIYGTHPVQGEKELADGGGVDWSARLLNNQKERMLISGIGTERLVELFGADRREHPARATPGR